MNNWDFPPFVVVVVVVVVVARRVIESRIGWTKKLTIKVAMVYPGCRETKKEV